MKKVFFITGICLFLTINMFSQRYFYAWDRADHTSFNISHKGNISLGTTQQRSSKLLVDGAIRIIGNSPNYAGPALLFGNTGHSYNNDHGKFFIEYVDDKGLNFGIPHDNIGNANNLLFISNTRKVGIGTDDFDCIDCADYKLFVKSGIKTEKIKVEVAALNGWADYVFDKDYNLMPLQKLNEFILKNKHLPEVPTEAEAIANGIELKEMNILLLKKVEELTLYLISHNKKLEKLTNEVKLLNK